MLRLFTLACAIAVAFGHGMMHDPASRNACWRHGFKDCPTQYDDNALNCGGYNVQWQMNGGKCGVCGDAYNDNSPWYVFPGKYATEAITKTYEKGQVVDVRVQLTANHMGKFKFRIGNLGARPMTEDKLTRVVKTLDGKDWWRVPDKECRTYDIKLRLPSDLTCDHCVMQWYYRAGNNWGCDSEGCGLGYGPQETFVNCADVRIV